MKLLLATILLTLSGCATCTGQGAAGAAVGAATWATVADPDPVVMAVSAVLDYSSWKGSCDER